MALNDPVGRVLEWLTVLVVSGDARHRERWNQRKAEVVEVAEEETAGMT